MEVAATSLSGAGTLQLRGDQHVDRAGVEQRDKAHASDHGNHEHTTTKPPTWGQSCQPRSGRKRIVAPDGSELAPSTKLQPDGTLVKALARAWRWQRLMDGGEYPTIADLGSSEHISRSYVSRILRLRPLAPDAVARILDGSRTVSLARVFQ